MSIAIGVRDSGVGGLTVARCIQQQVPDARLLYFADTAHVPYGERMPEEVRHYALSISRFLIEQGAQILVFACNTSSALALPLARETFDVPIYGTIEPGALAAAEQTRNGKVGVLATRATVESGVYSMYLRAANRQLQITEEACPEFVPLVENEQECSDAAREAVKKHLAPLLRAGCDTVVLGCTHYPLLLPLLREAAPDICFVDPAETLAANVALQIEVSALPLSASPSGYPLAGRGHPNSTVLEDQFWASGESEGVERWIGKLLAPAKVQPGPVFDLG